MHVGSLLAIDRARLWTRWAPGLALIALLMSLPHTGICEGATDDAPVGQDPSEVGGADKLVAWWNDPSLAKVLQLQADQRAQMDSLLEASEQRRQAAEQKRQEARRQLDEAIRRGDLSSARETVPSLRRALGDCWDQDSQLMLDILSILNPDQRQELLTRHPNLLQQPWEEPRSPLRKRLQDAAHGRANHPSENP